MIADNGMRKRDERFRDRGKHKAKADPLYDKTKPAKKQALFRPGDFIHDRHTNTCTCPAGEVLYSNGSHCTVNGRQHHKFTGAKRSCVPCALRDQCLRKPKVTQVRQVAIFYKNQPTLAPASALMRQAIDSDRGRALYSQRIGTVEPVFGNIRYNKQLNRFTLRGRPKVNTQWHLYCVVHNIEKIARH